ncbi:MAG: tail fiber domain-containing protein [Bdellovibrionales bacterium]
MSLKNKNGFTLAEVLVSTAIFSGMALTIAEIMNQSNLQLAAFNLRQAIVQEHQAIENDLLNRVACLNTFTAANVTGAVGTATPATPRAVLTIRDDIGVGGNILHTPAAAIAFGNYLPRDRRIPPIHAAAITTSKFYLQSVLIKGANTTQAYAALNVETNLPPNSFLVEFRYRLNQDGAGATVSADMVRAFGMGGVYARQTLFTAEFNGNNIIACNSSVEAEFDDIYINSNLPLVNPINNPMGVPMEHKFSPLEINGRFHVEEPSRGLWAERFYHNSDKNLKSNIRKFSNPIDDLIKLRGVEFDWIKSGTHDWGLVAQEVEKVYPNFVQNVGPDGKKSVSYDSFVAPVIESQKFLKAHRESIENEKVQLEKLLNQIESSN